MVEKDLIHFTHGSITFFNKKETQTKMLAENGGLTKKYLSRFRIELR